MQDDAANSLGDSAISRDGAAAAIEPASPPVMLQPVEPVNIASDACVSECLSEAPAASDAVAPATPAPSEPFLLTPARPGPGFFGAIAALLALFLLQIPFGVVLGVCALALKLPPNAQTLLGFQSAVSMILSLGIVRFILGTQWSRKIAIRLPSMTHAFLVSLLVIPLAVVDSEISRALNARFWSFVGTDDESDDSAPQERPDQPAGRDRTVPPDSANDAAKDGGDQN